MKQHTNFLSLLIFVLILLVAYGAFRTVSAKDQSQEKLLLEEALHRSILQCYAIEGRYPESLDYLVEHYGLTYNKELFYVDYQPLGSDLTPDVTILVRGADS